MNDVVYEMVDQIDNYTAEVTGQVLKRTNADGLVSFIPLDEGNSDYQAYLASLDEPTVLPEINQPVEESESTELADEPASDTE
jgi:hypothetical protein